SISALLSASSLVIEIQVSVRYFTFGPSLRSWTFTLMSATSTHKLSVQVSDFEDIGLLIQLARLICDFCSSDQRFACGFLQLPPRDGHPCRPANDSPCRVRRRLSLLSECALPGAQTKTPGDAPGVLSFVLGP